MKNKILLTGAFLALSCMANAITIPLTTLTGTLGTQTINVAGYGNVTISGTPAPGDLITSPFGVIMGVGDGLSITFSNGPVTSVSAVVTGGTVVGPTQASANTYLFVNNPDPTGQTFGAIAAVSFEKAVPEPSSAMLLTLGVSSVLLRRRK